MGRVYSLEGRLGNVRARGAKLKRDVADAVTSATLNLSTTEVTQLTLAVEERPDFRILASGLFAPGTPTTRGSQLDYGGLRLEVRAVEVGPRGSGHTLTVTARSIGVCNLRRAKGPLNRKGLTPTQFAALEAKAAGLKFVGQSSAKRPNIRRTTGDDPESSWDTLQRLASELGYVCFEAAGVLYFGQPTWLAQRGEEYRIRWQGDRTTDALDALPRCRRTGDDEDKLATVDLGLRGAAGDDVLPGMGLVLDGIPTFEGRYLITSVDVPLAEGQPATVTAATPINPEPQPPAPPVSKSVSRDGTIAITVPGVDVAGATGATGSGSAAAFVAIAQAQAGDTYIYGAEASAADGDPNAFDCSELVEWAAARVGVRFVDGSSAQIAAARPISVEAGIRTRGALLWHPGHIAISLGNGMTIEAANSRVGVVNYSAAGRFQRAGLIPGLRY